MFKNIVFDCDNTFGVKDCDVDDGLALLYILGSNNANLLGLTCTYGNSDIETVYEATKVMLKEIGHTDIPVLKGCAGAGEADSEAVEFLLDTVNRYKGNISILATGSLTNIYAACKRDSDFFEKVNEVSLMGGITEPLLVGGRSMNELNFSCDPEAAYNVLTKAKNVAVATGNNCLPTVFSRKGNEDRLKSSELQIGRYIYEKTAYWYDYMKNWGVDGTIKWDVAAAAYLLNEQLFYENEVQISPDIDSLKTGQLIGKGKEISVKLPAVLDPKVFEDAVYEAYFRVGMDGRDIEPKEARQ